MVVCAFTAMSWPATNDPPGMNESCHTPEWVTSRIRTSHVARLHPDSHVMACHRWPPMSHSHIWRSHVSQKNEWDTFAPRQQSRGLPPPRYEWVMSHIWLSHTTHMNESWHTYEWVMAHIWMSYVTHMTESWHTYEWVMSHIWMSHVTHVNESRHTYEWVMSHICALTAMPSMTLWVRMGHGTRIDGSRHTWIRMLFST